MRKKIFVVLVSIIISSCLGGSPNDMKDVREQTPEGIVYETFYIEGMPCMRVGRSVGDSIWEYDGVTCDWSKWDGNK